MQSPVKKSGDKPGLNIRISLENQDTVEMLDDIDLPEDFKQTVLESYLKHLFEDLASRSVSPSLGISKNTFLEVLRLNQQFIVSKYEGINRRKNISLI